MARKRINWKNQPLGQVPDRVIATRLGVARSTVSAARRRYASVIAARAQHAAISQGYIDGVHICTDDRCDRLDVHAKHPIDDWAPDPFHDAAYGCCREQHGQTLREIVYRHTPVRHCKMFKDIYQDVLNDYGSFVSDAAGVRAVWRAIADLVQSLRIVNVAPQLHGKACGGYVRGDSPLLNNEDGRDFLLESLKDAAASSWT